MLFDRNIDPCCEYCRHGSALDNYEIACVKQGIMSSSGSCRHFAYEPTKRVPRVQKLIDSSRFSEDDFTL